jgi:hypothetical protein
MPHTDEESCRRWRRSSPRRRLPCTQAAARTHGRMWCPRSSCLAARTRLGLSRRVWSLVPAQARAAAPVPICHCRIHRARPCACAPNGAPRARPAHARAGARRRGQARSLGGGDQNFIFIFIELISGPFIHVSLYITFFATSALISGSH